MNVPVVHHMLDTDEILLFLYLHVAYNSYYIHVYVMTIALGMIVCMYFRITLTEHGDIVVISLENYICQFIKYKLNI